jgi:mannose-1-phosphate guanylyltransferase/phosphomannomutase
LTAHCKAPILIAFKKAHAQKKALYMRAMIWAAGLGTRLRPLTESQPKAMVPVLGKPMLEHAILLCRDAGIEEIMINLHYFPDVIREYFEDGRKWGVRLQYSFEETLLENAGALVKVKAFFQNEPFVALGSDNLSDIDLRQLIRTHESKQALVTIATTTADDVTKYGIIGADADDRITSFQEKPAAHEALGDQIATLFYVFDGRIFDFLPNTLEVCHFGKDVFPLLLNQQEPLYVHRHQGYWNDIGNPTNYLTANFDALSGKFALPHMPPAQDAGIYIGENSYVSPNAKLTAPVLIGNHCYVDDHAQVGPNIVIGDYSKLDTGATVSESVLWEHASIGRASSIETSVLAKHTKVYPENRIQGLVLGENSQVNKTSR